MERSRGLFLLLSLTVVIAISAFPQDKNILKFVEENGGLLQWDPYREIGIISSRGKTISFRNGDPWILVDFLTKVSIPPTFRNNGSILLSKKTEEIMKKILFPTAQPDAMRIAAIFIDPGHGGKDPGTIGKHIIGGKELVLAEKDIVLKVSQELSGQLRSRYPEKKIILSRNDDSYLTLEERPEMANSLPLKENEAIIFISVHANASLNPKAKGFEVWYLPPNYRRNLLRSDGKSEDPKEILPILNTMLEEEFTVESILLAKHILKGIEKEVGVETENRGLKDETWFVVRKAKMPSVLVEIGFVTNPEEAANLSDAKYLKRISMAIYNGIVSFIESFEYPTAKGKT